VLAAGGGEVADLGQERIDGQRLRRRLLLPAQGEQAADLFLEDGELAGGDAEAVVGRARRAAAAVEVYGELRAGDGIPQLVGEAGGELPRSAA